MEDDDGLGASYFDFRRPGDMDDASPGLLSSASCAPLRVRNIVLILDLPPTLWATMSEEEKVDMEIEADEEHCASLSASELEKSSSLLDSVAAQLALTIEQALLLLATENVDIFAFRKSLTAVPNLTEGSQPEDSSQAEKNSSTVPRNRRGQYSRAMLIRSIAESLSEIIARSPHVDFVRAAENCLFSSSSAIDGGANDNDKENSTKSEYRAPRLRTTPREDYDQGGHVRLRYSFIELRQAIESKLQSC
ncbi:unnamed protein product [Phytomonas sp. EM1]|nr:unnamed protein product [Phytomonas sp. EM1]|eukprot:CCW60498.1 unnamed protein product [Phytomonas sp. isolate EM1]